MNSEITLVFAESVVVVPIIAWIVSEVRVTVVEVASAMIMREEVLIVLNWTVGEIWTLLAIAPGVVFMIKIVVRLG